MSYLALLNQQITIYPTAGRDRSGAKTFGTGVIYRARFRRTTDTMTSQQKEIEPIDGVVQTTAACAVEVGDKLVYDSTDYRVMSILDAVARNGSTHHKELKVQEWNI